AVVERLVVLGLSDERTRRQVARILMGVLPDVDMQSCIRPWSFWIRLYAADPQIGALASSLEASERRSRDNSQALGARRGAQEFRGTGVGTVAPSLAWSWLRGLLLELYNNDAERRCSAARHLAEDLQEANGAVFEVPHEPHITDPFRVCLDNGVRDDLVVPAANPRLARSFRPADVSNLLAILANEELALELRRSAAEQMLALAAEERLREVLEQEASLYVITCVAALRDPATGSSLSASQTGALGFQGIVPPTPDLLSTLDVQLPLAAVNLLFVLAAHSPKVRAWLVSERSPGTVARQAGKPHGTRTGALNGAIAMVAEEGRNEGDSLGGKSGGGLEMIVSGILPMVFHSMVTVRRAVARLLAALCFGSEADRWSGWSALATGGLTPATAPRHWAAAASTGGDRTSSAGDVLLLPYPFQRCYSFPCRVTWLRLPPACQPAAEKEALEGRPRLQDLLSEQRHLVVLLIQERQALHAAGGDLSRLLALMNERPDCLGGLPPAAQHTLAFSMRALAPGGLVSRSLAAVRAATSHEECTAALREVQLAVYSRQGAAALAAADWQVHFEGLLSTAPISPEDHALWVELLEPLRRALASGAMSHTQLMHLAEFLAGSALEVLSAPDAAVEPPVLPVALAGSAVLASQPDQHSQLQCTLTVLATLVDLVRCARIRLPAHQGLRVLAALSLSKLLRTLGVAYLDNAAASYGCRAQAVQLLQEMTALLTVATRIGTTTTSVKAAAGDSSEAAAAVPEVLFIDAGLVEALLLCLKALLGNQGGFAAAAAAGPRLASSVAATMGGAVVDRALHERQAGGFAGKGAVRMSLHCLLHLTALLPPQEWASLWEQLSGSFWVSRLLRDRDSVLRALAAEVLARLLQPGATGTQAMVAQGWPEAVKMMSKLATDSASCCCYALRAASLRVLACCMAQDAVAPAIGAQAEHVEEGATSSEPASGLPRRQLFASFSALPPAAFLMQNEALWAALPRMLREPGAPAPFLSAALTLLLQCVLLDGERTATLLQHPGLLERLLQLLDVRLLLDGGGDGGASPPVPLKAAAGTGGGSERAALLLVVLGQVEVLAGPAHHVGGNVCGSSGGVDVWLVEGDAAAAQGTQAAAAAATAQAAALFWAGFETDVQLEGCAGLETGVMPHEEWAACAAGVPTPQGMPNIPANCDPARRRQHLHALQCAALVAQLLAHTMQDPPLLHLQNLGRSPAEVAAVLLASFARVAGGVAAWDEARRALPPPRLLDGAARLEAVQHTAAAANAALQLLDADGLVEAVVPLDAELKRSSAPLLTRCAEVLRADCSPRPLRLVVVCLMATLLSRREAAFRLLRFEIDSSDANEHLVGSTGREVGAELCAALLELLPDEALLPGRGVGAMAVGFTAGQSSEDLFGGSRARSSAPTLHGSSVAAVTGSAPAQAATAAPALRGSLQFRSSSAVASQDLRSDSLCVIVALRNLLSYSCSAKTLALRVGYHRSLLHGCARTAAALTATGPVPGGGGPGERASAVAAIGPGRVGARRGALAAGRGQGLQRKVGSGPATKAPGLCPDAETASASAFASAFASVPSTAEPTLEPRSPLPAVSPVARSSGTAMARQDADRAATRQVAEQKLVASLSLLRHLAYGSAVARQALVQDGMVATLRSLWPLAAAASTSGPLFHELLSCVTNMIPECTQARARVAQEAGSGSSGAGGRSGGGGGGPEATGVGASGTLLGNLLTLMFTGPRLESATFSLAIGVLLQMSAAEDGTQLLLKSPLLGLCQKVLQDLSGVGGGCGTAGVPRVGRDAARQVALLELLANLASWSDGQRALLRSSSGPGLLDLVLRLICPGPEGLATLTAQDSPAMKVANPAANARHQQQLLQLRNAALAVVRNLCFAPEAKAHLLAHPGVLPSLVAAVEAVADNPQGAAYAASGMHALAYHGEKVKAALRRVPSAEQRLVAAYASCRFAEDHRAKVQQNPRPGTENFQLPETARAGLGSMLLGVGNKPHNWIHLASSELCGLLMILQATSTENSHPNVFPPDGSTQRDQYA
ncbi:hypothetical protein Vretifemale_4019, partial [Volvox reticuliferus]